MKTTGIFIALLVSGILNATQLLTNNKRLASYVKDHGSCANIEDVGCGLPGVVICQITIENEKYTPYVDDSCISIITSNINTPTPSTFE
jgi:hypothetical protein